jgi:hypothetical protein
MQFVSRDRSISPEMQWCAAGVCGAGWKSRIAGVAAAYLVDASKPGRTFIAKWS